MITRNPFVHKNTVLQGSISLLFGLVATQVHAQSTDIANVPMAVANTVTPNVLVIYDNSESMDAYMNGTMVSGNNANTRGNIGRTVMRNSISTYKNAFNWGLMSYGMSTNPPTLYSTYAYYLGSDADMVFTSNCTGYTAGVFNSTPAVPGTSTDGGGKCIANPEPSTGREFVTFKKSSDDKDIVDVLYFGSYAGAPAVNQAWAPAANTLNPTTYSWFKNHKTTVSTWTIPGDFSNAWFNSTLTPTDAGYIPGNFGAAPNNISRSLYTPRGWGYLSSVTGSGTLNEAVMPESTSHQSSLQTLLANETTGAGDLKNGAVFTTLRGTLQSAKAYFSGSLSGSTTPVTQACQQNFVMLVTDGLPTGDTNGALYSEVDRTNSCVWSSSTNTCTSGAFGTAATHARDAVKALRTTTVSGLLSTKKDGTGVVTGNYDVQTYVVALGDTVANPLAYSVMNAMGYDGGTDNALPATDAVSFQNAMTRISDDITAKVGAGAAVAVANAHVTSTDNASYASSYNSGTWTGDIDSNGINVTTGAPLTTSLWTSGTAATQLDLRTSTDRYIATASDVAGIYNNGVQFQGATSAAATKLSAAQQTLLNSPSLTDGASVLAYLRGDRTGETALTYRVRAHLLGDMINGEPLLVREPNASYVDAGYSTFKSSNASRTRMLFQGANDGMLHAFVASTGVESWAYIPNLVMANLNNLSRRPGFTHLYYVDGTPVSGDVDFKKVDGATGSGEDWRTVLVGALGKGGRGYYALDVTTTTAANEVDVKNKVLWEFPNSISNATTRATAKLNMGYSYGKPIIVKTVASGWVVLITSGYNNGTNSGDSGGDGLGHLYVVNPKTGDLINDISTPACATTPTSSPCGLAQISAYVNNADINNTTDYVYGGDLQGNVWRFDLTANNANSWSVAKFTTLKDGSGNVQAITTAPELTSIVISGVGSRMVFIGTGKYLGNSDVSTTQTQTMYGLRDSLVALPTPLRSNLQVQTFSTSGATRTFSSNTVDYTTKKGWYVDLLAGERLNTDSTIALSTLIFTSNIPSAVVCVSGGSSWEYFLDVTTGGRVEDSTASGVSLGDVLASRPVIIQLPGTAGGAVELVSLVRKSNGTTDPKPPDLPQSTVNVKRISWRELIN